MNKYLESIRCTWIIIRTNFLQRLVYRFNLITGFFNTFIILLVFRYLWISLYGSQTIYNGVTLSQTLTYIIFSLIFSGIYPNELIWNVEQRLRTGNILFDITRPFSYMYLLWCQTLGAIFSRMITTSLPILVLSILIMKLQIPSSILVWCVFFISWSLGLIISFFIDFLASLIGFWTTGMTGIFFAKQSLVSILTGIIIPLWIFPMSIQNILHYLPFPAMNYTPLCILIGKISPDQFFSTLSFQGVWIVILFFSSRILFSVAVKKIAVQGG